MSSFFESSNGSGPGQRSAWFGSGTRKSHARMRLCVAVAVTSVRVSRETLREIERRLRPMSPVQETLHKELHLEVYA